MARVKDFNDLEKDEDSGAVILHSRYTKTDFHLDRLIHKVDKIEDQLVEIFSMLNELLDKHK